MQSCTKSFVLTGLPALRGGPPAPRAARIGGPWRGLAVRAAAFGPAPPAKRKERLLPLLSELIETQDRTATFEVLAGRAAMIGFAVAAAAEALLPAGGLFGAFDPCAFAAAGAALVSASAALAWASPRRLSRRLLEPVLASLTSESRSGGSLSGRDVDTALDCTLEDVFSFAFLRTAFPLEGEDPPPPPGPA